MRLREIQFTVYLSEDESRALDRLAAQQDRTKSAAIRVLLKEACIKAGVWQVSQDSLKAVASRQ
jgi:predicted transcriptional regulator